MDKDSTNNFSKKYTLSGARPKQTELHSMVTGSKDINSTHMVMSIDRGIKN